MPNSQDNENAAAMAFVGIAMFTLFAVALFAALLVTVAVLVGAVYPYRVAGRPVGIREAKLFIGCGVVGAVLLALFCAFVSVLWRPDPGFQPETWPWVLGIGYTIGSLVWLNWFWEKLPPIDAPFYVLPTQEPKIRPMPQPFEFAAWDDEERR